MPKTSFVGPFYTQSRTIFASVGDEPLMFRPFHELSSFQRKHVAFMKKNIASFAMSQILCARKGDFIVLDKKFESSTWSTRFFEWHLRQHNDAGFAYEGSFRFSNYESIYPTARRLSKKTGAPVSTVCYSYLTQEHFKKPLQLEPSQIANSKISLSEGALTHKFPTPESIVCQNVAELRKAQANKRITYPVVAKIDGLGGGENVFVCTRPKDLSQIVSLMKPSDKIVIQQKINSFKFSEFNLDYLIFDDHVEPLNLRYKLNDGRTWIGNVYSNKFKLSSKNRRELDRCAEWIRETGYRDPRGLIAGLNFFFDGQDCMIFEVNGRWGGGTPVGIFIDLNLSPLGWTTFSHVEKIHSNAISKYENFTEKHLFKCDQRPTKNGFKVLPVAFSPYKEGPYTWVWFLVMGVYSEFAKSFKNEVTEDVMYIDRIAAKVRRQEFCRWF